MLVSLIFSLSLSPGLAVGNKDDARLSKAQCRFSAELFKALAAKDYGHNFVFSPYNIYSKVLDIYKSTSGEEQMTIAKILRLGDPSLVNVVYFKGFWAHPPSGTEKREFTLSNGDVKKTEFLSFTQSPVKSIKDSTLKADIVSIPYRGNDLALVIILPTATPKKNKKLAIDETVKKLSSEKLEEIESSLKKQKSKPMDLLIPAFVDETTNDILPELAALGSKDRASKNLLFPVYFENGTALYVDLFKHKSKVTKEDSIIDTGSGIDISQVLEKFQATHPFIYIIYSQKNQNILFLGVFNTPK